MAFHRVARVAGAALALILSGCEPVTVELDARPADAPPPPDASPPDAFFADAPYECLVPTDCTATPAACHSFDCVDHQCTEIVNDTLTCDDSDPCTSEVCEDGLCVASPNPPRPPIHAYPIVGARSGSYLAPTARETLRARFEWRNDNDDCGTPTYDFRLTTGAGVVAGYGANLSDTHYEVVGQLPVNTSPPTGTRYYWSVRACRMEGTVELCSDWNAPYPVAIGRVPADFNGDGRSDVAVAAPGYGNGRVWVFPGSTTLDLGSETTVNGSTANTGFASAIATGDFDGDGYVDLAVGEPAGGADDSGEIRVYRGANPVINTTPTTTLVHPAAGAAGLNARLGSALATVGDLNADGYDDLVAGAPGESRGGFTDEGTVYIFFGSATGLVATPAFILANPRTPGIQGRFGASLGAGGDLDGDSLPDFAIGSPNNTNSTIGATMVGTVYVIYGAAPGTIGEIIDHPTDQLDARFGSVMTIVPDLDGDRLGDLAVGVPLEDVSNPDEGAVYVYLGQQGGISTIASEVITNNMHQGGARFGAALGAIEATGVAGPPSELVRNVDEVWSLIIAAPGYDNTTYTDEGTLFIYNGASPFVWGDPSFTIAAPLHEIGLGFANAEGRLDVNGDGLADLIAATPYKNIPSYDDAGALYVYGGSALAVSFAGVYPRPFTPANQINAYFGSQLTW